MNITRRELDNALKSEWSGWPTLPHAMTFHRQVQEAAFEVRYREKPHTPESRLIIQAEQEIHELGVLRFSPDRCGTVEKF